MARLAVSYNDAGLPFPAGARLSRLFRYGSDPGLVDDLPDNPSYGEIEVALLAQRYNRLMIPLRRDTIVPDPRRRSNFVGALDIGFSRMGASNALLQDVLYHSETGVQKCVLKRVSRANHLGISVHRGKGGMGLPHMVDSDMIAAMERRDEAVLNDMSDGLNASAEKERLHVPQDYFEHLRPNEPDRIMSPTRWADVAEMLEDCRADTIKVHMTKDPTLVRQRRFIGTVLPGFSASPDLARSQIATFVGLPA